jgi:hypothetical protein
MRARSLFVAVLVLGLFGAGLARAQLPPSQLWEIPPVTAGHCLAAGTLFGQLVDAGAPCSAGSGMSTDGANSTSAAQQAIATSAGSAALALGGAVTAPSLTSGAPTGSASTGDVNISGTFMVNGTPISTSSGAVTLNTSSLIETLVNEGATGTAAGKLVVYTTGATVKKAATTDTSSVIGICVSGVTGTSCGTTGNASVAISGQASCVFDGATTAGDFVIVSTTTAGDCHDAGSTVPTAVAVFGQVLSTNGGGGTYVVDLSPIGSMAALNSKAKPGGSSGQIQINSSNSFTGITLGGDCTFSTPNVTCTTLNGKAVGTSGATIPLLNGTNTFSGAQTFGEVLGTVTSQSGTGSSAYTFAATDCGTMILATGASAATYTVPNSLPTGCNIAVSQETASGQVTIAAGASAVFNANPHSYTKTFGQYAIISITVKSNAGSAATFTLLGDGA